uniref:Cuticular protein 99 n=1 Tax=Leptinotarsa decemlineata TaxID=7539 RepID=A0A3Q8HGI0_LEPDE|nr:cuticular protein 99 [Leptinotarsa decemlineata]
MVELSSQEIDDILQILFGIEHTCAVIFMLTIMIHYFAHNKLWRNMTALAHAGGLLLGGYGGGLGLSSGLGLGGGLSLQGGHGIAIAKQAVVDVWAPPKYEYKYGVDDAHTGDLKQKQESRIGDLTKSEYGLAEKDRQIQVSRVIAGAVPLVGKGYGY